MKQKQFTFKKEIKSGPWRSFQKDETYIKLNGEEIGVIHEITSTDWVVRFQVMKVNWTKTPQDPCPWKWISLKKHCSSEQEAREMALKVQAQIMRDFKLKEPD